MKKFSLKIQNSLFKPLLFQPKPTTRSHKRKVVEQQVSGEFETSLTENNTAEYPIPGPSKPSIWKLRRH